MTESWTIKAYQQKKGKRTLIEWATGFGTRQAREYYQRMYDTNLYSEITMKRCASTVKLFKN